MYRHRAYAEACATVLAGLVKGYIRGMVTRTGGPSAAVPRLPVYEAVHSTNHANNENSACSRVCLHATIFTSGGTVGCYISCGP